MNLDSHRKTQNGSKSTNHRSQTLTFGARLSKVLFPKRSVKMIDGSEKRKRQLVFELQICVFMKSAVTIFRKIAKFAKLKCLLPKFYVLRC